MAGGFYIYAIAATDASAVVDAVGIDGNGEPIATLVQGDIAAIISRCSADRYEVARANVVAHQRVMEEVIKRWTILPVRFNTIADSREQIIERLLILRRQEFRDLLNQMAGKVELGLKALWTDMSRIFAEIVEENREIRAARTGKRTAATPADVVRLGEMVKNALEGKKEREAKQILRRFDGLWFDRRVNDVFGDPMFLNASFLVANEREKEFDRSLDMGEVNRRVRLRYVGPMPPTSFVEIVVTW